MYLYVDHNHNLHDCNMRSYNYIEHISEARKRAVKSRELSKESREEEEAGGWLVTGSVPCLHGFCLPTQGPLVRE